MTSSRHRDTRQTRYAFTDEYLVVCPRCEGQALVCGPALADVRSDIPARFSCTHCGLSSINERRIGKITFGPAIGGPYDGYYGLRLWLATECCGEILYANNAAHLALLESFIGAQLRERRPDEEYGWKNQSLASRLPPWMKSAKNRERVLAGIRELAERLKPSR